MIKWKVLKGMQTNPHPMTSSAKPRRPTLINIQLPKTGGSTFSKRILYHEYADYSAQYHANNKYWCYGVYWYPGTKEDNSGFLHNRDIEQVLNIDSIKHCLGKDELSAVTGHCSYGIHTAIRRPYKYMSLVRHPVSRVISLCNHFTTYRGLDLSNDDAIERLLDSGEMLEFHNDQTRRLAGLKAPSNALSDGRMLDQALENLKSGFALVGTTELFKESVALASLILNWDKPIRYRPINQSRLARTAQTISERLRRRILDANSLDEHLWEQCTARLHEAIKLWSIDEFKRAVNAIQDNFSGPHDY